MSYNAVLWSEWFESVRKDVESTFSHLKNRFRWIGGKIDYFDPEFIEAAFKCCCIPRGCFDTATGKKATANCVVAIRGRVVSLRVKKGHSIAAGSELSYAYGRTADRLLE